MTRSRSRRYVGALVCAITLAGAPAAAQAAEPERPSTTARLQDRSVEKSRAAAASERVVTPGERVRAGAGVELWLTEEGKHWSTPEVEHQFRSVVDGNIDLHTPSIGMTAETVGDRYFLSGIHVTGHPSVRVVVRTSDGEVTASVVRLPGRPGWGVWYTDVALHENLTIDRVTLQHESGREIASLTPSRP
ncbi:MULTISPECIES: hypothetical protein [Streptomyces]|uniref:hypothetical protein n=1 Tax=Streptomyces TaxID=1883 RepID=UPI000ABAF5F6|nr:MULTISPECIES: hypothetical protein [Streptomyces]MZD57575.1 hypothetical protein [Streptomyces sp. SID5606]GGS05633.1 hypothetical protein GCM10010220_67370 [Streptomyces parvulus]